MCIPLMDCFNPKVASIQDVCPAVDGSHLGVEYGLVEIESIETEGKGSYGQ